MTVFIDREGHIRQTIIGPRKEEQFIKLIKENFGL